MCVREIRRYGLIYWTSCQVGMLQTGLSGRIVPGGSSLTILVTEYTCAKSVALAKIAAHVPLIPIHNTLFQANASYWSTGLYKGNVLGDEEPR